MNKNDVSININGTRKYNILDLFAGAGGLSLGFVKQGNFRIAGVIEINENALTTYKNNHKNEYIYIERDIKNMDYDSFASNHLGTVDVIIGGPPCQGFSNANRQKSKFISMNNSLVKRYVDAVLAIKPRAFVMENVAMLRSDVHKFFDSRIDHKEVVNLGIKMKEESSVIMNQNPDGNQMLDVLRNETKVMRYYMDDALFNSIKVIKRYLNKQSKLENYFKKYSSSVVSGLTNYSNKLDSDIIGKISNSYINTLLVGYLEKKVTKSFEDILDKFIELERAIGLMKELYDNQIDFELCENEDGKIEVRFQSYTVFDYLFLRMKSEYEVASDVLNAADFGAPQERRRFVMIGVRLDLMTGRELHMKFDEDEYKLTKHTVADAVFDLEQYDPNKSVSDPPIKREGFSANEFTRELQDGITTIYNHVNTDTREIAKKRFAMIKPGKNFHSLDTSMKKDTYSDPTRTQNTIYQRLEYDKPCGTVVNVRKSMWIHPTKDRAISIREAARLQTFPDSYIFYGSKDSQYQQIGNAVPPILAKAIAKKIYRLLNKEE